MSTSKANNTADDTSNNMPDTTAISKDSLAATLYASQVPSTSEEKKREGERWQFLKDLPPNTSEYEYPESKSLDEIMNKEYSRFIHQHGSPFVVFTDVPREEIRQRKEFPGTIDYSPILQILILNIPSLPHEEGAEQFNLLFSDKMKAMGVRDEVSFRASTWSETAGRIKPADRSWAPRSLGKNVGWPTVALEVAFSESRNRVKHDVDFWLNQSGGQVRKAISIDIKRDSGIIYVVSWGRGIPTQQTPQPEPEPIQEVKLYPSKNLQREHMDGDDLVILFEEIMARDLGNSENDFIFTKDELLDLARKIWWTMEF